MTRKLNKIIPRKIRAGSVSRKIGQPPGTLYYVGDDVEEKGSASVLSYNPDSFNETEWNETLRIDQHEKESTYWYHVNGLHDIDLVAKIGSQFGLTPLLLEDIINSDHLPKMEEFDSSLLIISKAFLKSTDEKSSKIIHLAIIVGDGYILSFQEKGPDVFHQVRERIITGKGKIRERDAGYLMYTLLDMAVDTFYVALETSSDEIDSFEEDLDRGAQESLLKHLMTNKRALLTVRKTIFPIRESINQLLIIGRPLISKTTISHLHDVKDHCIQIMETTGFYIELNNSLKERYITSISLATNKTMQVLTVAATIFIPLTFLVGVYGMNFEVMPEIHWPHSYFVLWGIMITIALLLVWYFKRKKLL